MKSIVNLFVPKPSIVEIAAYQHKLPHTIEVEANYDELTKFWTAKVIKLEGKKPKGLIITEAKTVDRLVEMVNDAVLTYLDFPEYMKSSMPALLPEDIGFAKKTAHKNKFVFAK